MNFDLKFEYLIIFIWNRLFIYLKYLLIFQKHFIHFINILSCFIFIVATENLTTIKEQYIVQELRLKT
jgi:hypothetical protein